MENQENEGLLSPWIKSIRLKKVAKNIPDGSTVLDVACGAGSLRDYLPESCNYIGVDRIEPPSRSNFDEFFCCDIMEGNEFETIFSRISADTDYVVMTAFLEHIKDQVSFLSKFTKFVHNGGSMLGTTPHPIGRTVHETMAKIGLLSRGADEEHEDFLDKQELAKVAEMSEMRLSTYQRFLMGMNQLFVFESPDK